MHKTLAEPVEALVLCIGEAEMTYTSTSSVTAISALCNGYIMSFFSEIKHTLGRGGGKRAPTEMS